jgi:signal peptidase I
MPILSSIGNYLLDIIETIVVSLLIFLVVYVFVAQPFQVKGNSMKSTLHDGEYLLISKIPYRFSEPKMGDIIVFEYPNAPQYDYIKRIIALPGDTFEIKNNLVFVNDKQVNEVYLDKTVITKGKTFLTENTKIQIPSDNYFVMGDNREQSSDSRQWGFLPKKNIIGKAWIRYWPIAVLGKVH